jgi:hypothetical protein
MAEVVLGVLPVEYNTLPKMIILVDFAIPE